MRGNYFFLFSCPRNRTSFCLYCYLCTEQHFLELFTQNLLASWDALNPKGNLMILRVSKEQIAFFLKLSDWICFIHKNLKVYLVMKPAKSSFRVQTGKFILNSLHNFSLLWWYYKKYFTNICLTDITKLLILLDFIYLQQLFTRSEGYEDA